jgi:hypothetical protein
MTARPGRRAEEGEAGGAVCVSAARLWALYVWRCAWLFMRLGGMPGGESLLPGTALAPNARVRQEFV